MHLLNAFAFIPLTICSLASLSSCGSRAGAGEYKRWVSEMRARMRVKSSSSSTVQFTLHFVDAGDEQEVNLLHVFLNDEIEWQKDIPPTEVEPRIETFRFPGFEEKNTMEVWFVDRRHDREMRGRWNFNSAEGRYIIVHVMRDSMTLHQKSIPPMFL